MQATSCGGSSSDDEPKPKPPVVDTTTPIDEVVLYEAYPGMFGTTNGQRINAITARLDDIKALGVNVLWIMPVFEQGVTKSVGSPYCIKDFKAMNTRYGTLNDLKTLVTVAHTKGIRVILDWIANHTAWDNAWVTDHKAWYTQDAGGNIISPAGFNWTDVADLNFNNTEMRTAMIDAMKYWITEADVDGFRCDYADGVPTDFWSAAISEFKKLKGDDLLMLAESSDTKYFNCGFDMVYGWNFAYRLQELYAGTRKVSSIYETHASEYKNLASGKHRMRHIINHDMNNENAVPTLYKSLRGAISAYVIAATMGGCPMIYSSQEIGYASKPSFFSNYTMNWSLNPDYLAEYEKIMAIRKASTALKASANVTTYAVDDYVACYKRYDSSEEVLVIASASGSAKTITLPMDFALKKVTDLMSGSSFTTGTTISLGAYDYLIWKIK